MECSTLILAAGECGSRLYHDLTPSLIRTSGLPVQPYRIHKGGLERLDRSHENFETSRRRDYPSVWSDAPCFLDDLESLLWQQCDTCRGATPGILVTVEVHNAT